MTAQRRNETYITEIPQLDCGWTFFVPAEAEQFSEEPNEFLEVLGCVIEAATGLLRITDLTIRGATYEMDRPLKDLNTADPREIWGDSIQNPGGITNADIARYNPKIASKPSVAVLRKAKPAEVAVNVELKDGAYWIGPDTHDRYKYWSRRDEALIDVKPTYSPLTVSVVPRKTFLDNNPQDAEYRIRVSTVSDIWFQRTVLGMRNAERLGDFFRQLCRSLDVFEVEYYTNTYDLDNFDRFPELNPWSEK